MNDIELTFINDYQNMEFVDVVISQRNQKPLSGKPVYDETAIAWTVLKNCRYQQSYVFNFSTEIYMSVSVPGLATTPRTLVQYGQQWQVVQDSSGISLQQQGTTSSDDVFAVQNNMKEMPININLYRHGRLMATEEQVLPQQNATFSFDETIYMGINPGVREGDVLEAMLSNFTSQLSLSGLLKADVRLIGYQEGFQNGSMSFILTNEVKQ